MNKKKFPKAILAPTDRLFPPDFASDANEPRTASLTGPLSSGNETAALQGTSNVVPISSGVQRTSSVQGPAPSSPAVPLINLENRERRTQALIIVNRHAAYSAAGGLIPLPLATFAGVTTVIVRMVKMLSSHYGVPFQRDRARAIVVGLVGGAIPSGAATISSSALLFVLPPSVLMTAAVSSVAAAAFTRSIGRIFIAHFESGATLDEFLAAEARET